jgi:hypothetical protein
MVEASKSRRKRNTRKKRAIAISIPSLKQSFDRLEHETAMILKDVENPKQRIRKFQGVYKEIFGRPVEAIAAEAYLHIKMKGHVGRKTRKAQNGGAPIAGAPLDFHTRPGIDGVHGSFPQYVTSGLSFYNTINQDQLQKGVGLSAFNPAVPSDMGSNQVGGDLISNGAFLSTTRPTLSMSPATVMNDIQTSLQGRPLGASPDPSQTHLKFM